MKNLFRPLQGAFCILMGILCAMSFVVGQGGYAGMSELPASATSYLWTTLAACFALFFHHVYVKKALRPHALDVLFGLLFGVVNAFGIHLFSFDTWEMGLKTLSLTALKGLGQSLPMTALFAWMHHLLTSGALRRDAGLAWFQKHEKLWLMLILIVCWSPYLIAFFPGTVCWDLGEMVAQFFGQTEMDTWHPVFTTWVMGSCVWLGRLFGSDNLGAALFTLLQTLALSHALSEAVLFMGRTKAGNALRWAATAFFALLPIWGGYAQFISKDTLYTSTLLLFTLTVLDVLLKREADLRDAVKLFAWGLLSCLLRSNGLYVVLPTALLMIPFAVKGKSRLHVSGGLAMAVVCAMLFSNVLIPALGIRDETASGIYSVCFQQSARVLRDHADEVTEAEYAEIDRILDAENLPTLYEPWISDPVKYTFRFYGQGAEAEKEALARYRGTWLSMMKKYPLTYLESFFAGNLSYYTFAPKIEGETYNNQAGNRLVFETYELGDTRGDDPRFLDTTQAGFLEPVRKLLALFARGWRHIPVLSLLYACATYTWVCVGAASSLARCRKIRLLIGFLPALLSLGVCMLSPVNDYFRYFLPIVAMTLPLVGYAQGE